MGPINALSIAVATRKIPPLKEAPPTKVMSCALVALTNLERAFDVVKEVTGGADAPSAKMAGRPANSLGRPTMVCGHSAPRDEGLSPPAHQGSPCARGYGTRPVRALFPHPMIGKEHRSVTPTCPTMGVLTTRKVTVRRQLVVPLSSSDNDLPLVKHDTWVDLNPSGVRIRYTQEPTLVSDSPPPSSPPYIVLGQRVGARYDKVLIPNTAYKGKGHAELASSHPTPRV
jgi:hypothetical protein